MDSYIELTFQNAEQCLSLDKQHLNRKTDGDNNNCDGLVKSEQNNSAYQLTFTNITVENASALGDSVCTFRDIIVQEVVNLEQNNLFYLKDNSPSQVIQTIDNNLYVISEVDKTDDSLTSALIQINTPEEVSTNTFSEDNWDGSEIDYSNQSILNDVTSSDINVSNDEINKKDNSDKSLNDKRGNKKLSPKEKSNKTNKTEEQYECNECGKTFREKSHLATHSRAHINIRNFSCDVCGQRFKTKANLYFHSQTHSDTPFTCTECNKTFQERRILKRHIRVVHSHKELHKCNQCDKTFKSATVLSLHYTLHTDNKPFRCSMCPKTFVYKSTLATHINQYHQCSSCLPSTCRHSSRPWLCTVCGKGYSLKGTLNTHMRTHDPEKHYKCTKCPKTFANKMSYETHMKWHAGEGPQYMCDQCSKSYFNVFALKRHYKKHVSQKNFICEVCSKAYWMKDALKVHMRSHTNVKPFQCQRCPKAFFHKHSLEGHMKSHHSVQEQQQAVSRREIQLPPVAPVSATPAAPPPLPSIGPQQFFYYQLTPVLQPVTNDQNSSHILQVL